MTCVNSQEEGDLTETFAFPFDSNQNNMATEECFAYCTYSWLKEYYVSVAVPTYFSLE